jgi:hypothetical protein
LGAAAVCLAFVAMSLAACSSSSKNATTNANTTVPANAPLPPPDAWQLTLNQVKADGTVSTATALSAFALAIGPVPGAQPTSGPKPTTMSDGSVAIDWVFQHWGDLSAAQQQAVFNDMGAQPIATEAAYRVGDATEAKSSTPPPIKCPSASSADAGTYLSHIPEITSDLGSHMGATMHLKIIVVMNKAPSPAPGEDGVLYTYGCNGSSASGGALTSCVIHVTPAAASYSESDRTSFLIHEMEHCFVFNAVGGAAYDFPAWYEEGSATWAEGVLGGGDSIELDAWKEYLEDAEKTMLKRTYDGVGFFVHLDESGGDAWHALIPMAKALAAHANAPGAAWDAAGIGAPFLDSWGSGYVQGEYPGAPWTSGGGAAFPHQPAHLTDQTVGNGSSVNITALPGATAADALNVTAEVLTVSASTNGRLSLGGGNDVVVGKLTNPYCTRGSACKCPSDSANADAHFTNIAHGTEYFAVTSGLAAAKATLVGDTLEDYCKVACVVGTWRVENEVVGLENASGGAGATWRVMPNGFATIDYSSAQPLTNPAIGLSIQYSGEETDKWHLLPGGTPTAGTWQVTTFSGDVSAKTSIGGNVEKNGKIGFDPNYTATGAWTCGPHAMTAAYSGTRQSVTLERIG